MCSVLKLERRVLAGFQHTEQGGNNLCMTREVSALAARIWRQLASCLRGVSPELRPIEHQADRRELPVESGRNGVECAAELENFKAACGGTRNLFSPIPLLMCPYLCEIMQ